MATTRFHLTSSRTFFVLFGCTIISFFAIKPNLSAQDSVSPVVVTGEEVPSAYGAPPAFSRSRFAPLTNAYVLPPWGFFFGTIYEGDAFRHGPPDHMFTQEVEMGLPHRFGVAAEVAAEEFNGEGQARSISLEGRYAFADWNKIPLNPTIFAEYKFGLGHVLKEEGGGEEEDMGDDMGGELRLARMMTRHHHRHHIGRGQDEPGDEDEEEERPELPDAYEFRLLLSQDFGEKVEWAMNWLFRTGNRGRPRPRMGFRPKRRHANHFA